jgi:hypothetical protein
MSARRLLAAALALPPCAAAGAQESPARFINPPGPLPPTGCDQAHPPANTMVPVASLARPELLLAIEAVAELRAPARLNAS